MSPSSTMKSPALADKPSVSQNARIYLLPKHGLPRYLAGLVLQVVFLGIIGIALALVAFFAFPETSSYAVLLVVFVFLFLPIGTVLMLLAQKKLWQLVEVEMGDCYIAVRHGGVPLEVRILPQSKTRVESVQITAIREKSYGLVISTQYDSEALVIPVQLDDADYREIAATLSAWCPVQPKSLGTTDAASRIWACILDSVKRPQSSFLFYERANSALAAGAMASCVIIALVTLTIVLGVRDLQVPTSQGVAILAVFLIIMLGTLIGFPIAFAWLDYGLASTGVGKPVRSGVWMGIITAVMISAVTIVARLSVFISLIAVLVCTLVVAGLAWFLSLLVMAPDHVTEPSTTTGPGSTARAAEASSESPFPIQGSYRLTADEVFTAMGYFYKAQPRSLRSLESNEDLLWDSSIPFAASQSPSSAGKASRLSKRASKDCSSLLQIRPLPAGALRLRHHLILLPRSINHKAVKKLASSHPLRNKVLNFSVSMNAITWKASDSEESTTSWERVTRVIRTPRGFLIYQDQRAFDWIPFHAFSRGGSKVFARLTQHLVDYSETA